MDILRYQGNTYFFDTEEHSYFGYENDDSVNLLSFLGRDYCGMEYKIEYRIMGPKDIQFAKRMVQKGILPWDVIRLSPSSNYMEDNLDFIY